MKWLTNIFSKLHPKKRPVTNSNSGKTFDEMYKDMGLFIYHDKGFTISDGDFAKTLKWNEITQLNVYKVDLGTIDRIDMEIVYGDKCFTINEELPGWYQFIIKTKEVFSSIPTDWDTEVMFPAFATNYKTIFNKVEYPLFFLMFRQNKPITYKQQNKPRPKTSGGIYTNIKHR